MTAFQCSNCSHYKGSFVCDAYKKRIPQEIFTGEHDHRKPYKGDNGIQFEAIKK